jgi:autotransporter passenger strand-loop-strand repeat protein
LGDLTAIFAGGSETVSAGGTDDGAQISGGTQTVFGLASGATVSSGGTETVSSGGTATSTTISNGGTEYVSSGGQAQNITFAGAAALDLASPSGLSGTISGWQVGDPIDFTNFAKRRQRRHHRGTGADKPTAARRHHNLPGYGFECHHYISFRND